MLLLVWLRVQNDEWVLIEHGIRFEEVLYLLTNSIILENGPDLLVSITGSSRHFSLNHVPGEVVHGELPVLSILVSLGSHLGVWEEVEKCAFSVVEVQGQVVLIAVEIGLLRQDVSVNLGLNLIRTVLRLLYLLLGDLFLR